VFDSLKKRNLTNCGRGHSIIFFFKPYFLERNELTSDEVFALVYHTVSSLAELLQSLVAFQLLSVVAKLFNISCVRQRGSLLVELLHLCRVLVFHFV